MKSFIENVQSAKLTAKIGSKWKHITQDYKLKRLIGYGAYS